MEYITLATWHIVILLASFSSSSPAPDPTPAPQGDVKITTACTITSTSYPTDGPSASSYSSMGLTGIQNYCTCGDVIAGINLATSGASTTTYCATGGGVPLGYTQIGAVNGEPTQVSAPTTGSGQCKDGSVLDESCFNALDLPDYLPKWWQDNQGKCQDLPFANCFYKLATPYSPSNCSQINVDSNCDQPKWDDFKTKTNGIQDFYVAWNIYQTNGFFTDMYTAIGNGEQSASASLGKVIQLLAPPEKKNVLLNDILMALAFSLALYAEGSLIVKALIRTAPGSATLFGKLFPTSEENKQLVAWEDVADQLGTVTKQYQDSVAEGLPLLQDDMQSFIKWSQESGLSGNRPSLNDLSTDMAKALSAYATSRAIADLGIVVLRAPGIDVNDLQSNHGKDLVWDTGCKGYENGVCTEYFFDGKDTYALTDPNHQTHSYADVMKKLFLGSDALTEGKLLFTAAYDCLVRTGKNGDNEPIIDPKDPTQTSCLSVTKVCTYDMNPPGPGPFDSSCKNLPDKDVTLPRFGVSGCIGDDSVNAIDAPKQYLGPGIWKYEKGPNPDAVKDYNFCNNVDV